MAKKDRYLERRMSQARLINSMARMGMMGTGPRHKLGVADERGALLTPINDTDMPTIKGVTVSARRPKRKGR